MLGVGAGDFDCVDCGWRGVGGGGPGIGLGVQTAGSDWVGSAVHGEWSLVRV